MWRPRGFTLIELLVVISIIALLIGILLPALGSARTTARQMQSSTHVRGIHQGCVMFAQGNRGWYPGLRGDGEISQESESTLSGAEGQFPQGRYGRLLEGSYVTPGYLISPGETGDKQVYVPDWTGGTLIKSFNFSYAMLRLDFTQVGVDAVINKTARVQEWRETISSSAVVLSDRNVGLDTVVGGQVSSIWTPRNGGEWRGTVTRNDNSTVFESSPVQRTRYGSADDVDEDNILEAADGGVAGDNAAMVHVDEVSSANHE